MLSLEDDADQEEAKAAEESEKRCFHPLSGEFVNREGLHSYQEPPFFYQNVPSVSDLPVKSASGANYCR